ncbi:MAG: hypothetical protein ACXVLX_03740 [Ilumatobacteraceae bacterium]
MSVRAFLTARSGEHRLVDADGLESRDQRSMKQLWLLIAVTMVLLGINKQLDLQTLLIQKVRKQAYVHGWYSQRRRYQVDFIATMLVVGLFATIGLAFWLRRVLRRVALAIAGIGMLVLFVVIRAASFHYVDKVLSLGGRVRVNWILELSGIGLIIVAALQWQYIDRRLLEPQPSAAAPERGLSSSPTSVV